MTTSLESPSLGRGEKRFRRARSPAAKLAVRNRAERRQFERAKSRLVEAGVDLGAILSVPHALARLHPIIATLVDGLKSSTARVRLATESRTLERLRKADEPAQTNRLSRPVPEPAPPSFSAGPRARAILRGADLAAKDLADSGGSYSLEEVRRLMNGVSRQSIEKRVREGRLLAVIGRNNKRCYPVAQFDDHGAVVDGLRAVHDTMATRNGYAVLNFLVNPDPKLDNLRPIDLLKAGDVQRVVEAASRSGEQGG